MHVAQGTLQSPHMLLLQGEPAQGKSPCNRIYDIDDIVRTRHGRWAPTHVFHAPAK